MDECRISGKPPGEGVEGWGNLYKWGGSLTGSFRTMAEVHIVKVQEGRSLRIGVMEDLAVSHILRIIE